MAKAFRAAVDDGQAKVEDVMAIPPLKVVQVVVTAAFLPFQASKVATQIQAARQTDRLSLSSVKEQGLVHITVSTERAKAVKSNDAATDYSVWNNEVSSYYDPSKHGVIYEFLQKQMG